MMVCVRFGTAMGSLFQSQVKLIRTLRDYPVAGGQCAVCGDDRPTLIPVFDVNLSPQEHVAILLENKRLHPLLDHGLDR